MSNFVIVTDSSADLGVDMVQQLDVQVLPLSFILDGHTYHNYPDNREMDPQLFYGKLRAGEVATTAAVNVSQYIEILEPLLQAGQDVLILAFSSGLSATYNSSTIAVQELAEKYPERKLYTVDTLCASLGQGLLVYLAAQERAKGRSIKEVRDWAEANKLSICHQFTVDDLHFLKRGGRISATTAVVGSMLQIKPVLHVDNEGHLVNIAKSRGRQSSSRPWWTRWRRPPSTPAGRLSSSAMGTVRRTLRPWQERTGALGVRDIYINYVGPGDEAPASGPGTLALFYVGKER